MLQNFTHFYFNFLGHLSACTLMVGYRRQLRPAIDFSINICAPQLFHTLLHLLHETLEAVCVCVCVRAFSLSLSLCVLYVCVCTRERQRNSSTVCRHRTSPNFTTYDTFALAKSFFFSFFLSFFLSLPFFRFFHSTVMENYLSQIWKLPFWNPQL